MTIRIEYHSFQQEVFYHHARFKVLFAGRRWGKTRGAINWLTLGAVSKKCLCWWVSPTYRQAKIAYRYFRKLFYKSGIIARSNESELTVEIVNGSIMEFRSADIPDNLRGEGIARLVVDECATVKEDIWTEILRPAIIDAKGEVCFIGTPKGMNWFYQLWLKGQGEDPNWKSWKFSSYTNPFLDAEEIKQAESEMPELVARQEIWAEPLESEGVVFRNVDQIATLKPEDPVKGLNYVIGADLAKYQDFTVLTVKTDKREVFKERFNKIDWAIQKARIMALSERYNRAKVILDSTGVGDPIFEDLHRSGLNVEPYVFTNTTKRELIDNLIIKFDKKEIRVLDDLIAKAELKEYQYEMTSGGKLKSGAPAGKHDDCVISMALAFWSVLPEPAQALVVNRRGRVVIIGGKKRV